MPNQFVSAANLANLSDGIVGKVIDGELAAINKDLEERSEDGKPRKLVITLTLTPTGSGAVEVDVKTKTTLPAVQPPKTIAKLDRAAGGLRFNPEVRKNPDQTTLTDLENDNEDKE